MELYYIIVGLVVILIWYYLQKDGVVKLSSVTINKVKESLVNIVKEKENFKVEDGHGRNYDLYLELKDVIYLIKVISATSAHEIVITNKITWILNRKKDTPSIKNKIPGVKEFIEYQHKAEKTVKKVAIVYPNAYNILKYINENEMVIVNPKVDIYGCRIIQYSNLSDIENL